MFIQLNWLCAGDNGYRIDERPEEHGNPAVSTRDDTRWFEVSDLYIERTGKLHETTPLGHDGLWRELADCRNPMQALAFVSRWGFLQRANAKREAVGAVLARAEMLRRLAANAERQEWREISRNLADHADGPLNGIGKLAVIFEYREGMERPELRFQPRDLGEAIHVQALMDISGNATLRKCFNPACPAWFRYGPGTEHRETAKYCSSKCQGAHAYAKRKVSRK